MWVIVLAFATYRITRLIIADKITEPLRLKMLNWMFGRGWTFLPNLLMCSFCVSVWVAAAVTWAADIYHSVPMPFLTGAAIAGGSSVVWSIVEDD